MRYPELSFYKQFSTKELSDLYNEVQIWSAQLASELETRDEEIKFGGIRLVVSFTTTTDYKQPVAGSMMYATSSGTYYGWDAVTSTWDALN